ncbi:hypothetical protein [Floridanema aerugineum]|uniref:Uncharacterized protein n=1 Tax=Floridaenema aerugineum BLCC-F46 TaxID=3153654 RepID=A0ABV4X7A0_9CYAN
MNNNFPKLIFENLSVDLLLSQVSGWLLRAIATKYAKLGQLKGD